MHFKLIIALVEDKKTDAVLDAARKAGATGSTILNQVRGEGIQATKTFFGLNLENFRFALHDQTSSFSDRAAQEHHEALEAADGHAGRLKLA